MSTQSSNQKASLYEEKSLLDAVVENTEQKSIVDRILENVNPPVRKPKRFRVYDGKTKEQLLREEAENQSSTYFTYDDDDFKIGMVDGEMRISCHCGKLTGCTSRVVKVGYKTI